MDTSAHVNSMRNDGDFFKSRLAKIEGAEAVADALLAVIRAKTITENQGAPAASSGAAVEKAKEDS